MVQKAILEEGKNLVTSAAWPSVLEYVLSAAQTAAGAPDWDDSSKNNQKKLTLKALDGYMKQAATKGKALLDKEACKDAIQVSVAQLHVCKLKRGPDRVAKWRCYLRYGFILSDASF